MTKTAAAAPQDDLFTEDKRTKSIEEESYDSVPYESYVYPQTHPDQMHTIAKLFKMGPADLETASVLELGCAMGGNLFPLALKYPKANFVGMDISGEQIKVANTNKGDLGLTNIEFFQGDIAALDKKIGKFDYIICHGVFSWVPEPVRDSILAACQNHLSDNGLAVISYNVLPGWGAVKTLRDMMIFHTKPFEDPKQKVVESRNLLNFVHKNAPGNMPYKKIIEQELSVLGNTNDSYLFHEHLESENNQYYLTEFVDLAKAHDLAYVGDSNIGTMYLGNFNEEVQKTLGAIKDIVRLEQYIDFLINRRFRYSILTPKGNEASINRQIHINDVFDFYVMPGFSPEKEPKLKKEKLDQSCKFFKNGGKENLMTQNTVSTIIHLVLSEQRRPTRLKDLYAEIKERGAKIDLAITDDHIDVIFANNMLRLALQGFITLQSDTYDFVETISEKPEAYALARYQAKFPETSKVTTLRMQSVTIDYLSKEILKRLDGTKTKADVLKELMTDYKSGALSVNVKNVPVVDPKEAEKILTEQIDGLLNQYAKIGLLVS